MSTAGATSTLRTVCPRMSRPRIAAAASRASAGVRASLMPPALPRPPVCTWALTTTGPPAAWASASASSASDGNLAAVGADAVAGEDLRRLVLVQIHSRVLALQSAGAGDGATASGILA